MKNVLLSLVVLSLVLCLAPASRAQWSDDFESYALGSGLHGQGGWLGWDGNAAADAYVDDLYAQSGTQAALILSTSDIVQEFSGATSGVWEFMGYVYIPPAHTGQAYFIMLNTYAIGGPNNWSVQVKFENGQVVNEGVAGGALPWHQDQWAEIQLIIDLDTDTQTFFYDGDLLYVDTWTGGVSGGGVLNIGALDLFNNGGASFYYDTLSLAPQGTTPVQPTSWGGIKNVFR